MSEPKNDRALRFYNEVLGLDHLHYGMWNEDDSLTIENLKQAQQRYEDFLVDTIPEDVKEILDAGCGTGELSKRLKNAHYQVEGLSPDINQKDLYAEKTGQPFHFCRFEDFKPEKKYDCIIMSESGQYVPLDRLFATAATAVKNNGYLMSFDYFVLNGATGVLAKSGHNLEQFEKEAEKYGFKIIKDEDVTSRISKTLDFSKQLVKKSLKALEIGSEKFRLKHPLFTRFINRIFKKKLSKFDQEMELIDSKKFNEAKRYKLYLFQYIEPQN